MEAVTNFVAAAAKQLTNYTEYVYNNPAEAALWYNWAMIVVGSLALFTLVIQWVWAFFTHWDQNLKTKYNATWALVTGASSGIGLSLAKKLASQGLNVVMVALPDDKVPAGQPTLSKAVKEVQSAYKGVQVRGVGAILGDFKGAYLTAVAEATADIPVSLVFNNAGYMVTGFFEDSDWARHEANIGCNSTAAIALSHLFVRRMRDAGLKGCITFTSSPANIIPSPFSCLYGATKAMVTHFATSLACELKPEGIDVSVIHPSPVATNFYAGAHAMPTLAFFKSTAGGPDHVADVLIRGIGRSVIVDQGYYPFVWKLALRVLDVGFLANIMPYFATTIADYAVLKKAQEERKAKAAAALKDISLSASSVGGRSSGSVAHSPVQPTATAAGGAGAAGARRGSVSSAVKSTGKRRGSVGAGRR